MRWAAFRSGPFITVSSGERLSRYCGHNRPNSLRRANPVPWSATFRMGDGWEEEPCFPVFCFSLFFFFFWAFPCIVGRDRCIVRGVRGARELDDTMITMCPHPSRLGFSNILFFSFNGSGCKKMSLMALSSRCIDVDLTSVLRLMSKVYVATGCSLRWMGVSRTEAELGECDGFCFHS